MSNRWPTAKTQRAEARQQARHDQTTGTKQTGPAVSPVLRSQHALADISSTHRERKEQYIKALEQEVLRLKEIYSDSSRERDRVQQENQRLKALLAQHGISYELGDTPVNFKRENSGGNSNYHPSSSGSISGSYRTGSESATFSPPGSNGLSSASTALSIPNNARQQQVARSAAQLPSTQINYDDVGIDFVLTYDSQGNPTQVPAQAHPPYPSPPMQQQGL